MNARIVRVAIMGCLTGVVMMLGVLSSVVLADEEGIQVTLQEAHSDFPNDITFSIEATSPDPIKEIRVFFRPVGSETSNYGYLDIEPGTLVKGEHVMDTGTGAGHRPPGTVVRYFFEIIDSAGRELRTDEQEFLYIDEALEWKEISEGILTVYYYGDFVETRARTVLEASLLTMDQMGEVLGIRPTEPIKIVAYSNYRDMTRGLPFRAQAIREGLQTQGQAWPAERVLMVLSSETTVTGIASHEFTHILVAEAAGVGYALVPAWLNEGLAEFGNIDQTPAYDRALAYAIFTRRVKPLWFQQSLGGEPDDIVIGYGQGKSVVSFLLGSFGPEKMAELMRSLNTASTIDEALMDTYGFDQYGLDTAWRQALGLDPLPSPDELSRQLAVTPSPTATEEESPTPEPTPTALAEETPAVPAEPTDESPAVSDEGSEDTRPSRSCGASADGGPSLAIVALLGVPFLALRPKRGLEGYRRFQRMPFVRKFAGRRQLKD